MHLESTIRILCLGCLVSGAAGVRAGDLNTQVYSGGKWFSGHPSPYSFVVTGFEDAKTFAEKKMARYRIDYDTTKWSLGEVDANADRVVFNSRKYPMTNVTVFAKSDSIDAQASLAKTVAYLETKWTMAQVIGSGKARLNGKDMDNFLIACKLKGEFYSYMYLYYSSRGGSVVATFGSPGTGHSDEMIELISNLYF